VRWYDANIASLQLNQLDLSGRPAGKRQQFLSQAGQTQRIICCLENGELLRRIGECKNMDAVQQYDNDPRLGQADLEDGGAELESDDGFLLCIVPDDEL
jgi:hypothetical protein